jgi:hypothetical protein
VRWDTRAAEEAQGQVHGLRPDFQNQMLQKSEQESAYPRRLQADLALEVAQKPAQGTAKTAETATPWPAALPEQVRAVAGVLAGASGALALADIEARFKGRGPWKKSLPRILDTLEALGRARHEGGLWRA